MAGNLTNMIASIFSGSAVTADPYYEYTTLLLPGSGTNGAQNNTFLDSSTNNFTITRNGNTTQGTFSPFSQTGWGNYFDGTGDSLNTTSSSAFNFSTGSFTLECWFNKQGAGGSADAVGNVLIYTGSGSNNATWLGVTDSGTLIGKIGFSGSWATEISGGSVSNGVWNHVALVRNGTAVNLYLNGASIASASNSTDLSTFGTNASIAVNYLSTRTFNGYISNARIVKGTAVYTGNFTPPTSPLTAITNTSLLTCQSNRFIDNSTNNFTITRNGNTSVVAFSPFNPSASWSAATYGGSGYFDGSGDYLSIANNSAFDFGAGEFTLEFWWYPTTVSANQNVMSKWGTGGQQWVVQWRSAGYFRFAYNTSNLIDFTGAPSTPIANAWNHIAIVRSVNSLYLYLNGVRNATVGTISATLTATTDPFVVGQFSNSASEWFTGYASGLVVVKGGALYTGATLTVPTTPPTTTVSSGTVSALLNFTNAGIYDATSKNDLETVGDAQISNTTAKFGSTSIKFDGTGDYLTNNNASNPLISLGSGDFTVEGWIYTNTVAGERGFIQISDTAGGLKTSYTTGIHFALGASPYRLNFNVGGTDVNSGSTYIAINTWYHVAATRSSGSVRLFINGTLVGGPTTITTNLTGQYICVGGYYNTSFLWNGYIQDLRITKGYARYTANFTPPTAAFPTL
jgi:hypothetical protein